VKKRTALVSAGVAAGALAAGVVGRTLWKRHAGGPAGPIGAVPPEDLGRVASFDGTQIAVRAAGDPAAPVVILAHGFSLDASVWCEVWPSLSRRFRVVTFDHRSHGASGRAANGDLSLRAMGRDVAAVLDAVSPERPVVVVGHSMGAMAILAMAEQRSELFGPRVAGVGLMGAASSDLLRGAMGSVTELLRPRAGTLQAAAKRVDGLRRAVLASPVDLSGVVARVTQFGPDASREVVAHVAALAQRTASEVWTDALPGLMEMDLRHAVPRIVVPALVMVGEHDRVTPPAAAVALVGQLPQGRLSVVEGAGHIPMLEHGATVALELEALATEVLVRPARKQRNRRSEGAA